MKISRSFWGKKKKKKEEADLAILASHGGNNFDYSLVSSQDADTGDIDWDYLFSKIQGLGEQPSVWPFSAAT